MWENNTNRSNEIEFLFRKLSSSRSIQIKKPTKREQILEKKNKQKTKKTTKIKDKTKNKKQKKLNIYTNY